MVVQGKNGIYIIENGKISLLGESKKFKGLRGVNYRIIQKLKELIESSKR